MDLGQRIGNLVAIKQGLKEGDNVIGKIDEIFALIKGLDQKQIIRSLGIGVAVMAFVVLRTVVTAWHAGVEASIANRLITARRLLCFSSAVVLPRPDRSGAGSRKVTYATWFSGVYINKKQFFARLAVDSETFFDGYP